MLEYKVITFVESQIEWKTIGTFNDLYYASLFFEYMCEYSLDAFKIVYFDGARINTLKYRSSQI